MKNGQVVLLRDDDGVLRRWLVVGAIGYVDKVHVVTLKPAPQSSVPPTTARQ